MNRSDFKKAVPPMPNGFYQAMAAALSRAAAEEPAIQRRGKLRLALIAALVALCLLGTAFALTGGFGVLDFMGERAYHSAENEILPEAADLITPLTDVPEVRTGRMIYRAREAVVADGQVSLTLEATPIEADKYLLMGDEWEDANAVPEGSHKRYGQLAGEQGKTLLSAYAQPLSVNGLSIGGYSPSFKLADNAVYLYVEFELPEAAGEGPYTLVCQVADQELYATAAPEGGFKSAYGEADKAELQFLLNPPADTLDALALQGPVAGRGMTITAARFARTPFNSQISVTYTVEPALSQALTRDSVYCSFFWMKDREGFTEMQGDIASANTMMIAQSDGGKTYESQRKWQTIDQLPDAVYLRPYYWDSESWGDVIELKVKEG